MHVLSYLILRILFLQKCQFYLMDIQHEMILFPHIILILLYIVEPVLILILRLVAKLVWLLWRM